MGSSKTRKSSCSIINLVLSLFKSILLILSVASLAPTIYLKTPLTSPGYAVVTISSISIMSSFVGLCSQFCNITHFALLIASSAGQLLAILVLFTKEKWSLSIMKSARDPREAKLLVRLECGILMAMFVMHMGILILSCVVRNCCVRECEELESENGVEVLLGYRRTRLNS
ncbi:hypothetical protein ACS0TY_001710 [Phlomoides rotata]